MTNPSFLACLLLTALALTRSATGAELLDDRELAIQSRSDAASTRERLIQFVWGAKRLPQNRPVQVNRSVPSPIADLENLKRVDALFVAMECGQQTVTYHFIAQHPNRRLVIVHQGHVCELDQYGVGDLIRDLLREGYSVLGAYMPQCRPGDCTGSCTARHNAMFTSLVPSAGGPMRFFVEPIAVSLNYLESRHRADDFPRYREFNMAGLSGGGWTTTVYAALDPRIRLSFPVAGTMPLHVRSGGSNHAGKDVDDLLKEASLLFFSENGLNPAAFPSLRKFETEILAMAASLLGDENAVGTVTSGGTESLLMAVKTARDSARKNHPEIKQPEMILPLSGHPAFEKASGIFRSKSDSNLP